MAFLVADYNWCSWIYKITGFGYWVMVVLEGGGWRVGVVSDVGFWMFAGGRGSKFWSFCENVNWMLILWEHLIEWPHIEIILDNQVEIKFSFDSYVRGFYVYKDVWYPFNGEKGLECFHEKGKKHTRLRLPCTVMIFHGEILLDMY